MDADVDNLHEPDRLAVSMGLHPRLGAASPLNQLDGCALDTLTRILGWHHSAHAASPAEPARAGLAGILPAGGAPPRSSLASVQGCGHGLGRIAVDITFYSSQIKKNLQQQHGVRPGLPFA